MSGPAEPSRSGRSGLRSVGLPTLDQQDDEELIRRVARGDTSAFEVVYQRYAPRILGLVRRVLRDPAQSEEVAQEVLVEVWRLAARFDPAQGSLRAWVTTMARRRAIDRVRAAQAADARDVAAAAAQHTPDFDQVSETVEIRLDAERVRHCLGGLTGLQRESIELAFFGGYSHREVSDLLEQPLGTIKTRLRDGLIRLRDCMGVA